MSIPHFVLLSLLLLVKNSLTALAISKQPVAIEKGYASMQVHTLTNPVASTAPSSVTAAIASTGLLSLSLLPNSVTSMPSHTNLRRRQLLEQEPIYTQRAWLYSTVLPGLGQAYNKSYWKIPAIYGVFAGLAWGATYNHLEYRESKRELIKKTGSNYSLRNYVEGRKRDRNLFTIVAALWYILNIFDAYVEGNLKTFDVSDNLEVIVQPAKKPTAQYGPAFGLGLALSLKNECIADWLW